MTEERIYTIPLRKEFNKTVEFNRAKKAVSATREFLQKHMKSNNVKLGKYLNEYLLSRGRKNPPLKVQVKVWKEKVKVKDQELEIVKAELVNAPQEKSGVEKAVEKVKTEIKVEDKIDEKVEENIEKVEEEKKEVLTHPTYKKKESKRPIAPEEKIDIKEKGKERTKQDHSKSQKPTHEKKK